MAYNLKSNDNFNSANISLPVISTETIQDQEMEIYARFMRHLRLVPNSCAEIKVLSAIQFTADILNISDALIAKTLVDLGLRAPRAALPSDYLEHVDKTLLRGSWHVGGPTESTADLKKHWDHIGEDKFAAYRSEPVVVDAPMFIET